MLLAIVKQNDSTYMWQALYIITRVMKIWSWVPQGTEWRTTVLAKASSDLSGTEITTTYKKMVSDNAYITKYTDVWDSLLLILPDNPYSFALSSPRFPCSQGRNTETQTVFKRSVYCGIRKYITIKQFLIRRWLPFWNQNSGKVLRIRGLFLMG
jgi:hypothetical protein